MAEEIPKQISDLIESEETARKIAEICFENGVEEDEKIKEVAYQTGRVLLGDLPPQDFSKTLADKVEISPFTASKIAREINDSIFYPVRESLAKIYKEEVTRPEKPLEEPKRADIYREPIE